MFSDDAKARQTDPGATSRPATICARVDAVLDEFRPRLRLDGAELSIVELAGSGLLRLRMSGRNAFCPMALFLLRSCLDRKLRDRVPEVQQIEIDR